MTAPPLPFVPEELHFKPAVVVIMCYSGDVDEGREVVRAWLDLAPPIQMVDAMPYTVMNSIQDDLAPKGRHSYWKSGYLTEFPDDAIAAAAGVARVPSPFSLAELVLWGGAIGRVPADGSVFGHATGGSCSTRSRCSRTRRTDANVAWARDFYDGMQPFATDGVYVNFLSEEGAERVKEAYGAEKFARLAAQDEYDPGTCSGSTRTSRPRPGTHRARELLDYRSAGRRPSWFCSSSMR